jgi:hypothetical protein
LRCNTIAQELALVFQSHAGAQQDDWPFYTSICGTRRTNGARNPHFLLVVPNQLGMSFRWEIGYQEIDPSYVQVFFLLLTAGDDWVTPDQIANSHWSAHKAYKKMEISL